MAGAVTLDHDRTARSQGVASQAACGVQLSPARRREPMVTTKTGRRMGGPFRRSIASESTAMHWRGNDMKRFLFLALWIAFTAAPATAQETIKVGVIAAF